MKLRDLSLLISETKENIASNFIDEDVSLSGGFKQAYANYLKSAGHSIAYNKTTAVITIADNHQIFMPNQWFVLAAYAADLVKEIKQYREITENVLDEYYKELTGDESGVNNKKKQNTYELLKSENQEELVNKFREYVIAYFTKIELEENDIVQNTEYIIKFVTDADWWLGGKNIGRISDYYVSPILAVLNLVNASQSYVANIAYAYVMDEAIYAELPSITDGDEAGDDTYWPPLEEYNPNVNSEKWKEILLEDRKKYPATFEMLKTMLELGGEATCKKMAGILNEHPSTCVSRGNSLGKRVKKILDLPACMDGDRERFFPIPFVGRYTYEDGTRLYAWKMRQEVKEAMENILSEEVDEIVVLPIYETGYVSDYHRNRIIFGAPGTGKSYTIDKERVDLLKKGGTYERVTFHPDYTYANFVGTYKPVPCIDGITYEYVPGPFMRTLVKALKNGQEGDGKQAPHLLIIEEINRANVAAVFGDVFQLLDRDYNEVSEYPIQASEDMKKYLAKELKVPVSACEEIKIPDNMFIWATMNSADQGVFPMDTAFKRRWDFTYLGINSSEDGIAGKNVVLGTGEYRRIVEWNALRKAINKELLKFKVNEDKLMGPYFISKKNLGEGTDIDAKKFTRIFKNKVLMYLFDDAAKQKRPSLFAGCEEKNLYSAICDEFDEKGVHIFCEDIYNKFIDVPEEG